MFYMVGLGLGDAKDITVKGLDVVRRAKRVYLEAYTSILTVGKDILEEFYGREVILADREMVETLSDEILEQSEVEDIAFLVVGDPFGATTHTDLVLRAIEKGIQYKVIHNASIMNAVGCCGLQLYNYGEAVSIVFWDDAWKPDSFYDKIARNRLNKMHTLCLLDIKVKEQSIENLMKLRPLIGMIVPHSFQGGVISNVSEAEKSIILGKKIYEPPRYMTVIQAAQQLLEIIENREKQGESTAYTGDTICVGLARVGCDSQKIVAASLRQLISVDLGGPLHSLVIPGEMHPIEKEMLSVFACDTNIKEKLKS